jgi:N-methylhydantoinase B
LAGDRIVFRTAGAGGWGDPFDRDAELVARDARYDLVSREQARDGYGVVLTDDNKVDAAATDRLRKTMREERGPPAPFNFGFEPVRDAAE